MHRSDAAILDRREIKLVKLLEKPRSPDKKNQQLKQF